MEKEHTQTDAMIQPQPASFPGLVIMRRRRAVDSVEVLISELRAVGSANFQFTLFSWLAGLAFGLLVSVGVTLTTLTFTPEQVLIFTAFLVLLYTSGFAFLTFSALTIYFGIKRKKQIDDIINSGQVDIEEQLKYEKIKS